MEKEKIKEEEYLAEVTERLFSVTESFDALLYTVTREKRDLIMRGQSFAYQQGILDVVTELKEYAEGTRNLKKEEEELIQAILEERKEGKEEEIGGLYQ